jgi:hypothetical protein
MLENVVIQVPAMSRSRRRPRLPTEAQARRVEELRRAFQRVLNRRPTLIEKASMLRAAARVARAEALALDPNANVADVVKLNNLAARSLRALGVRVEPVPPKTTPAGLTIARARWAAEEAKRAAKQAAASQGGTPKDMTEGPPDGRAAE